MELIGILFVIAIWDVSRSAVRNARNGAPSASPAPAQASSGRSKGSASRGVRQRRAGYWLREGLHGFPAGRTGWHAGWLAHRAALAQQRNIREAARTNHIETERDTAASIREHRQRQAEALRGIEAELAAQQAKGSPVTGKKAVRQAADEVSRKREERQQPAATCPSCGAPDGYEHLKGCDPAAPPLPADSVRGYAGREPWKTPSRPEPEVIDTPVRVHNAEDSSWLRPGEPRCEGCDGTGWHPDGRAAVCPACRGWGSASPGPEFMTPAPDGTVCGACGREGSPADPVLTAPGGSAIHRSHAAEQHEAYADALRRLYPDGGQIDDAVIGADHGFEGEHETHPSPTTNGAPVTDTNYDAVMENAKRRADEAEQDAAAAAQRHQAAMQHAEDMQAVGVQGNTLSAQMELVDQLKHAEDAAKATGEQAAAVRDALAREHGGIKSAVDDAPIPEPAQPVFYGGS